MSLKEKENSGTKRWPCGDRGETGVTTKTKERLKPPETGRDTERCLSLEGAWPCEHLDLGLLASRIMEEYSSVVLNHQVCSN